MSRIQVLDSSIFNRIAAGEVVESPCSAVKELVENSIDAGADTISVEIRGGGIDFISVADNGVGIHREDMPRAFLPHATSKIKTLDDLNAIGTLGFRGEALPSIASVSEVTVTSRRVQDSMGYFITYCNGAEIGQGETGAAEGTTVTVKRLFENIPARRKFLKKPASEGAKITSLIEKLILANPTIAFTYTAEGRLVYQTDGAGAESAIYAIYGEDIEQLISISNTMSGITLNGFVSKPSFTRHNRSDQILIVNNRVVENEEIAYSVYLAYKDFLMTRRYPMYVLYIKIPYDLVDVNIHPNKLSVKFVDTVSVKKMISHTIRRAISANFTAPLFTSTNAEVPLKSEGVSAANSETLIEHKPIKQQYQYINAVNEAIVEDVIRESAPQTVLTRQSVMEDFSASELHTLHQAIKFDAVEKTAAIQIAGKLFNTYIIIQFDADVFLIDQHAAHERILYDRYISAIDNQKLLLQELLVPYTFTVSFSEAEFLQTHIDEINALGFGLKNFGEKTFSLSSIPTICSEIRLNTFVSALLAADMQKSIKKSDFLKQQVAASACSAAVKGKDDLTECEIASLLEQMNVSGAIPICPHGRPTLVKLSKTEIEKWFKRIV